jgi:hypothetical protein
MNRILRRLAWGAVGLIVVIVAIETIETYTIRRRSEEFWRRVGPIREGMTETEVRAVAGAPGKFVTGIGSTTDRDAAGASCREANSTAAMLYSFEHCGWMCEQLSLSSTSGTSTEVVCLDDRRMVVKTYLEMIKY